jgi:hypothetical protein
MTTTIINKATYDAEYAHCSGALLFPTDLWDCARYVDTTKLRKAFKLKGRGRILHILLRRDDDPLFVNTANKEIWYKNEIGVDKEMDGAYLGQYGWYVSRHPIGNAIVVLKE